MKVEGAAAFVTGANRGLGAAIAQALLDSGAKVYGAARDATWTTFEGATRTRFMRSIPVDRGTWARARGWALWKAVVALPTLPEDDPRNDGTRFGWRWTAIGVVDEIITEFRAEG